MDSPQDFKSLQEQIQAALITTTRTAGQISFEDLGFQRSLNPDVGTSLDEQNKRLLSISKALLKSAASLAELKVPVLQETDDVENNWRGVVDVIDSLLERADTCLDEYTGVIKRKTPPTDQAPPSAKFKRQALAQSSFRNLNLVKPQLAFDVKPDNLDIGPWKPILSLKPHASIPLEKSLRTFTNELQHEQYRHPYEKEINDLQYPSTVYEMSEPIQYLPVESTTATFVDTFDGVLEMLAELKTAKEIAVDLEHHDTRSYVGLVSLMQISIRQKDWIIDTLKPWRQDLQVLNEVFADPSILKIFHGAYMDIVWLQRDLGLYIVGLFDTHHAARVLGYSGGSLAYLLKRFVDFDADKQYQMADWRIRPLPDAMFYYARADTHYLLYIYDNMRNELVNRSDATVPDENRIELVLEKSKEVSLLRFERQIYDEDTGRGPGGWYGMLVKTPNLFNNEQFAVFRAVHAWRDKIARVDDDSTNFVMPNHVLVSLAKVIPTDMVGLMGTVRPISYNVKSRLGELLEVIKAGKAAGINGPSMMEILRPDSEDAGANPTTRGARTSGHSTPDHRTREGRPWSSLLVDAGSLRTEKSVFWGKAFGSSKWDRASGSAPEGVAELRLAIPLPQLATEAYADDPANHAWIGTQQVSPPQLTPTAEIQTAVIEEVFNVKAGRKRKSKEITPDSKKQTDADAADDVAGEYDISLDNDEEQARAKAASKAARKAQKKLQKAQRKLAAGGCVDGHPAEAEAEAEGDDEEPFDYSKAESVLHRKRTDEAGSKRKRPFDPYSKSTDAPKGMRRLQTERPGKSLTFKS